jgi:hypothetical protein
MKALATALLAALALSAPGLAAAQQAADRSRDASEQCRERADRMHIAPKYHDTYVTECVKELTSDKPVNVQPPAGASPYGGRLGGTAPESSLNATTGEQVGPRSPEGTPASDDQNAKNQLGGSTAGAGAGAAGGPAASGSAGYGNQNVLQGINENQTYPDAMSRESDIQTQSGETRRGTGEDFGGSMRPGDRSVMPGGQEGEPGKTRPGASGDASKGP